MGSVWEGLRTFLYGAIQGHWSLGIAFSWLAPAWHLGLSGHIFFVVTPLSLQQTLYMSACVCMDACVRTLVRGFFWGKEEFYLLYCSNLRG